MAKKLTPEKAKEILRDNSAQGHKLTAKQKRYFGYIAGGGTPKAENGWLDKYESGGEMQEYQENYNDGKSQPPYPIGGTYIDKGFNYNSALGGRWKNGGSLKKELITGKKVELEHKPTIDYIKEYHEEYNEIPDIDKLAESIAIDHIKDFQKIKDPKSDSYYKGLVENHLSDEVTKYLQGGEVSIAKGGQKIRDIMHKNLKIPLAANQLLYDLSGGDEPITEKSLNKSELNALRNIVRSNLKTKKNIIDYDDYSKQRGNKDIFEETYENELDIKGAKKLLKDLKDPYFNLAFMLGRSTIKINNNDTIVTDRYNFNTRPNETTSLIDIIKSLRANNLFGTITDIGHTFGSKEGKGSPVEIKINENPKFQLGGNIYTRRNGAPSEGRYAKKTIPSAQDGDKLTRFLSQIPGEYTLDAEQAAAALNTIGEVTSAPQKGIVYGLTGKYQAPSQAMNIQSPVKSFITDALLDPVNLTGIGAVAKSAGKAGSKMLREALVKGVEPHTYNWGVIKNIPENIRRVNKGRPRLSYTGYETDIVPAREEAWRTYMGLQKGGEHMIPTGIDPKTGLESYKLNKTLKPYEARDLANDLEAIITTKKFRPTEDILELPSGTDYTFGVMGKYYRSISPDLKSIMYRDVWDLQPVPFYIKGKKVPNFLQKFEVSSVIPGAKPFVSEGPLANIKTRYAPAPRYESVIKDKFPAYRNEELSKKMPINMKLEDFGEMAPILEREANINAINRLKLEMKEEGLHSRFTTEFDWIEPERKIADISPYFKVKKKEDGGEIPIAQEGKTVSDTSADFLKDWYKNRTLPTKELQTAFELDKPAYIKNTENFPAIRKAYNIDNRPSILAQYDVGKNTMLFKPDVFNDPYIRTHERTHFIDLHDDADYHIRGMHENIVKQSVKSPEQSEGVYKKDYDYYTDPAEVHARIMALRQKAGFKPAQTVTEEDLDKFLKSYKGEEINVDDIIKLSKDKKSMLYMLNNMVRGTGEAESSDISAEDGRTIHYKNGLDFQPKMMETGGSIQDKGQLQKMDDLLNFTNYNKSEKWLDKYK